MKLAIVGTGDISTRFLRQAAVTGRATFVATCARHLESAKARALEYGIEAWFDDCTAMYDEVRPDGVVIATPNSLHAGPAIAALIRGIHVLCEKPMATSWGDCQAMADAARQSSALLLCLPYDESPSYLKALEYLNEQTLGAFTGAEAQLLLPQPGRDNWYYDRSIAGGAMLDTLVYPVSRLIGMLGAAQRVTGFSNTLIPQRVLGPGNTVDLVPTPRALAHPRIVRSDVDDNVTLIIEWSGGQQAVLRALWGTSFFRNDTVIYGRHGALFISSVGDVIVHSPAREIPGAEPVTWHGYPHCYRVPVTPLGGGRNEGHIEHFVDCFEGIRRPVCGWQQQLHVHEILFKAYEAARSGNAQELETTFKPWHIIDPSFNDTRSRPV